MTEFKLNCLHVSMIIEYLPVVLTMQGLLKAATDKA